MYRTTEGFIRALRLLGTNFRIREAGSPEDPDRILITFDGLENVSEMTVMALFSPGETDVALRAFDLLPVPEGRKGEAFAAVNRMNFRFRFAKFCVDEHDGTIQCESDADLTPETAEETVPVLLMRMVKIADLAAGELKAALNG